MELLIRRRLLCAALVAGFAAGLYGLARADTFDDLTFRSIGPNPGRLAAVAGVPGDPSVYYAGGLGGLFKSTDGGTTFDPVFKQNDVSAIGAIAVAPSNPNVVYAGTGEPNARNDIEPGNGIWRSDDAGARWKHVGLVASGHIAQIAIDARDSNVVYVAAVGPIYGSGSERGVYKTVDGGQTWRHVLRLDDRTGASSVVIDPADPQTLFAGAWTIFRKPWILNSGGTNDGLYVSHDAGEHWARVTGNGFPSGLTGRIGLAYAPSASGTPGKERIYALVESSDGVLWRSDDGGRTWQLVSRNHALAQRPFYFSQLAVDPKNAEHVYFLSVDLLESYDGGKTAKSREHFTGDDHQMWIDPQNPGRLIMASDDGATISYNGGKTWRYAFMPISQVYHVDTDRRIPYTVCVEIQDEGSACGPSNSKNEGIVPADWFSAAGGESGWVLFDPANPNFIYGSGYTGALTRFDRRTNETLSISPWPLDVIGWAARDERFRFQWTAPIAVSDFEPRALYFGANVLFKSSDEGLHWHAISPDLTRNDKTKQLPTGGPITHDSTSVETYDTIFSIAESPIRRGELWIGTDDGLVWLSRDAGAHWRKVSDAVPRLNQWARVVSVSPSLFDPATAYLAVDAHLLGDKTPYLYVTHDYGNHWRSISGDLRESSNALVLKPDPVRNGLLYLGTSIGLYISFDEGGHWRRMRGGLPTVPVYDVAVQRQFDDLVVGTHGRGVYILDDLRPLQHYSGSIAESALSVFPVRTAYRWSRGRDTFTVFPNQLGQNPKPGALITFWLGTSVSRTQNAHIEVYDGARRIRTIGVKNAHAGMNRFVWNMRYSDISPVPNSNAWRSQGFRGPLVVPGRYRIAVTAAGVTRSTSVTVALDPAVHTSLAQLREQFGFLMRIRGDLSAISSAILRLRAAKVAAVRRNEPQTQVSAIGAAMAMLYQPLATQGEDILRYPARIYEQLSSLAAFATFGDAAPTAAQWTVLAHLETQMHAALTQTNDVLYHHTGGMPGARSHACATCRASVETFTRRRSR